MNAEWIINQLEAFPDVKKSRLAEAAGMSPAALSKVLNNNDRILKAEEFEKMRIFFGYEETVLSNHPDNRHQGSLFEPKGGQGHGLHDREPLVFANYNIPNTQTSKGPRLKHHDFTMPDQTMNPVFERDEKVQVERGYGNRFQPGYYVINDGIGRTIRFCQHVPGSTPVRIQATAEDKRIIPFEFKLEDGFIEGQVQKKEE